MMTKKNGRRKKFSKMVKASAAKLDAATRTLRARHAALVKHGMSESERRRDKREVRETISNIHAEMLWRAKQLVEANPDVPVGTLATDLQKRFRFYLTVKAARELIEKAAYLLAQGIVIPNPNPSPRFIATEAHLVPQEQPPVCERCGGTSKPTWIGPWSREAEGFHDLGDVIGDEPIYRFWCERCNAGVGPATTLASRPRRKN